jgi:DNA-binding XRE family transcriptional regulator
MKRKKFNLKEWRQKHGITQEEFAAMVPCHRNTIINIERMQESGEIVKSIVLLESFCELYDLKKK